MLVAVFEPGTRVSTLTLQTIFYFLNPFIMCPCCIGQDIADRHTADVLRCTGDEVAVVLLHLIHVRVTHDYLATNDSEFVILFAHLTPLDSN